MDLNQLLYHHQIAIMNSTSDPPGTDSANRFDLIHRYAKRIREFRQDAGLPHGGNRMRPLPGDDLDLHGNMADSHHAPSDAAGVGEWENEGGQIAAIATRPADGIVAVSTTHYQVGPYRYTALADAQAENRRQLAAEMNP